MCKTGILAMTRIHKKRRGEPRRGKAKNLELRILEVGVLNVFELGVLNGLHKISLRLHNKKIRTRMHQEVAHLNTPTHAHVLHIAYTQMRVEPCPNIPHTHKRTHAHTKRKTHDTRHTHTNHTEP